MTLQTALRDVTDNIKSARNLLAKAEVTRIQARASAVNAEANLDHTRTYLMAQPEAGSNEAQRRAYAQAKLDDMGLSLDAADTAAAHRAAEMNIIARAAALRIYEDERRYLELVAQMAIAGVADAPNAPVVTAYANGDSDEGFAR